MRETIRHFFHKLFIIEVSILLAIFFILVICPLGIVYYVRGWLKLKRKKKSYWEPFQELYTSVEELSQQG